MDFILQLLLGVLGQPSQLGNSKDLSKQKLTNAFGLAGTQASTLLAWENDRTEMSRPLGIGIAARNGVTASLLAEKGFAGPEILEGKYTIFNAYSDNPNADLLLDELGGHFGSNEPRN